MHHVLASLLQFKHSAGVSDEDLAPSTCIVLLGLFAGLCEGGEGGEGLKCFDMHVIVFVSNQRL